MNDRKHIEPTRTDAGRKAIEALGSPRDIQRQNLLVILGWLYRWGYSSADILSDLLGRKNRSHAKRLADAGWIQPVSIKGYPTYFVLTEKGQAEAIHHCPLMLEYVESDPYRVHLPLLHHNLIAQKETIKALRLGWYSGFITQRMFRFDKDSKPLKTPDVILVEQTEGEFEKTINLLTAVEIELTPKWNHHLDQFVTHIIDDLQFGRFYKALIISDSKAILNRYANAFEPGKKVPRWEKSGIKFIDTGKPLEIPQWVLKRVTFRDVDSEESYHATPDLP